MGENNYIDEDYPIIRNMPTDKNLTFEGWKNVHKAAYYNDYDTLLEELNNGECVNSAVNNFISLYEIVFCKKRKICFENMTPLYIAAQKGHTKCVKLLIDRGADPTLLAKNTYSNSECSALSVALCYGKFYSYWIMKNSCKNKKLNRTGLLVNTPLTFDYT